MKTPVLPLRVVLLAAAFFAIAPNLLATTVSPSSATVTENATKQFAASTSSTWKTSCGTISSTGLFKAALIPQSCTITATAKNGSGSATAKVTVVSPNTITPYGAKTPQGQTWQFHSSVPARWTASCGSINSNGLYTASGPVNTYCTIRAFATSGIAYETDGYDHIYPSNYVMLSPLKPTLQVNAKQQFSQFITSATPKWTASCGSITSTGLYTAPAAAGSCIVQVAAPPPPAGSAQVISTTVTIQSSNPLTISPQNPSVNVNAALTFTSSATATWTASCGTIGAGPSTTSSYTAPNAAGSCTIKATANDGSGRTASTTATIKALPVFTISPQNPKVLENGTLSFTASAAATWAASCGTINASSGVYVAPSAPGSCTVTGTATDGSGSSASTNVTVNAPSPLAITPASASIYALGNVKFSASTASNWSTTCGSIDPNSGVFTAPSTANSCTVTATDTSNSSNTSQATVSVSVVNYTTWLGDNKRTGANTNEFVLTPSNAGSLAQSWSAGVDGTIWHQPLYMNALNINNAPHNVVFVGTSNDSVYAIDGDTGAQLWQKSFLSSGVTAVTGSSVQSSMAQIGIVGTPVINPNSNTLYVVAFTAENNNSTFVHRLHALDITNGQDRTSPAVVQDPNFTDPRHNQRAGLLLANGQVYVSFGGIGDRPPYHGFVFAYDQTSLSQTAVFNSTSGGGDGGIWMGTAAPSVDDSGNVYVTTGNGTWDGTSNFGTSIIKLSSGLNVLDYFTPYDQASLSNTDTDLGSAGVLVLPDQPGNHTHELIMCGKSTPIYVLDRDNMGRNGSSSDNIVQRIDGQLGSGSASTRSPQWKCLTNPVLWQNHVYFAANGDVLKMFDLSNGSLSTSPSAQGSFGYNWPGAQPIVTSNGSNNGIVWTVDQNNGTVRANDANNPGNSLYASGRLGTCSKWTTATVVNGHVYVAFNGKVVALTVP